MMGQPIHFEQGLEIKVKRIAKEHFEFIKSRRGNEVTSQDTS